MPVNFSAPCRSTRRLVQGKRRCSVCSRFACVELKAEVNGASAAAPLFQGFMVATCVSLGKKPEQRSIVVHTLTKSQHVCSQMVEFSLEPLSSLLRSV